jgi:hypothetical protein
MRTMTVLRGFSIGTLCLVPVFPGFSQSVTKPNLLTQQFQTLLEKKADVKTAAGEHTYYRVPRSDEVGCTVDAWVLRKDVGVKKEITFRWADVSTVRIAHSASKYLVELDLKGPSQEESWSVRGTTLTSVAYKPLVSQVLIWLPLKPDALALEACVGKLVKGS